MTWYWRHGLFYFFGMAGWLPQYYYVRSLGKKIYKIYLMKGGKYCKVVLNQFSGERMTTWLTIKDLHLLSQDFKRYDSEYDFLTTEGQLKHEVAAELDYFMYQGYPQNNDVIYFMKEGIVHQPEIFENVLRGYNIDTSEYEINTEDNIRWMEPSLNY